jgi:hypothetical protein
VAIGDELQTVYGPTGVTERHIVTAEDATTQSLDVRNGSGAVLRSYVRQRDLTFDNGQTLRSRAQAALTVNAAFLALASPTNAQVVAQVQRVTKECSALIRLALNLMDDVSGT